MRDTASPSSRLAVRHLLAVILVTFFFSTGTLLYQVRIQYTRGIQALNDVLEMIEESYLPPVAAGVFYFDDPQLRLLAEGIALLPYVESIVVLERQSGEETPLVVAGDASIRNGETREFPLLYDYDGTTREIGALHVTTSLDRLREQILQQILVTSVATLLTILGFAVIILVVVQRMVFRHLGAITTFVHDLDPEHLTGRKLVLDRKTRDARGPDELEEITVAINTMLGRLDRAVKEKKALLQELYHRTGNMMQSVRAILRLQSSRNRDNAPLQEMVRAVDNRILAMALVHQKLYQGGNLSRIDMREYFGDLAREIFRSYPRLDPRVRLKTDIEELSLLIDTAIRCGMVLCELLSNSLQHAFPADRGGTITIALCRTPDGRYRLTVADDGVGAGSGFYDRRHDAIGIQSVTAIVETQLRGRIDFDGRDGVRWIILFSDDVYRERVSNG